MDRAEGVLRVAELALAEARRALRAVADIRVIEGPPGRDGFELEDFSVIDGEREAVLRFARGDVVKEWTIAKPTLAVSYRGVWKAGAYKAGDAVTSNGSLFLAQRDTESRPETNDDWRLAVKRGRDGKDGRDLGPPPKATVKL